MTTKKPAAPKSSPLPWEAVGNITTGRKIQTAGRMAVAFIPQKYADDGSCPQEYQDQADADQALIVRRVNQGPAFDAMVEALELCVVGLEPVGDASDTPGIAYRKARAALKLVQESAPKGA